MAFGSSASGSQWFQVQLTNSYQRWLSRVLPPQQSVTLNRKNIFILPTKNGFLYLFATALVFIAAINYAVSLAFGLAFMMVSIFILAILHAFNNLNHLKLQSQSASPVYCGDDAAFKVLLSREKNKQHEALELNFPKGSLTLADLVSEDQQQVSVFTPALYRGEFKAPRLRVTTRFPLGLCRAWSVVDLDMSCLVYPKPVTFSLSQFNSGSSGGDDTAISHKGSEDYYGLREYVPGDPLKQVAWKNLARGQGMHVKMFVDYADNKMWLDWDMFFGFSTEERLSRICFCALRLARSTTPYGLRLPGVEIKPDIGPEHRSEVLKSLALFRNPNTL